MDKNISLIRVNLTKVKTAPLNLRMLEFNLKEHKEHKVHSFNTHPQQTKADPNKESAGGTTILAWTRSSHHLSLYYSYYSIASSSQSSYALVSSALCSSDCCWSSCSFI